jgi:hypothetical protein
MMTEDSGGRPLDDASSEAAVLARLAKLPDSKTTAGGDSPVGDTSTRKRGDSGVYISYVLLAGCVLVLVCAIAYNTLGLTHTQRTILDQVQWKPAPARVFGANAIVNMHPSM